jgi:hypothetical protein
MYVVLLFINFRIMVSKDKQFISVSDPDKTIDVPINEDDTVAFSTVKSVFPGLSGLTYQDTSMEKPRAVK